MEGQDAESLVSSDLAEGRSCDYVSSRPELVPRSTSSGLRSLHDLCFNRSAGSSISSPGMA